MNNLAFIHRLIDVSDGVHPARMEKKLKVELFYFDARVGHPLLGWMRYLRSELRSDSIDWTRQVERRFQRFAKRRLGMAVQVVDGVALVEMGEA